MTKDTKATAVAVVEDKDKLPAHLTSGKTSRLGNVDSSDLILPRIKLLQAISPEVEEFEKAKAGEFWHSIAGVSLGKELRMIPVVIRKSYVLWSPRNDQRGVLARSNDGIHWDRVEEFRVKPKGSPKEVVWRTEHTVKESGLDQFGSSIPGDANSPPAASLTYNILVYLPDFPDLSPAVLLNTRSAVKKAKMLISKIEMRPVDHFGQEFTVTPIQEQGAEGPYWNYAYTGNGYASAGDYETAKMMYEKFSSADFKANDEADEHIDTAASSAGTVGGKSGKF